MARDSAASRKWLAGVLSRAVANSKLEHRADTREVRERAADRKADLGHGYPKVGVPIGAVDSGSVGLRRSYRGSRITRGS